MEIVGDPQRVVREKPVVRRPKFSDAEREKVPNVQTPVLLTHLNSPEDFYVVIAGKN